MRYFFLAVMAVLTASMSVSATPAVFSRDCLPYGAHCDNAFECCSQADVSMHCIQDATLYSPFALYRYVILTLGSVFAFRNDSQDLALRECIMFLFSYWCCRRYDCPWTNVSLSHWIELRTLGIVLT
ncbi:hypothetical protein DFH29DRAFT_238760 [Suillus ampliporus]|nr:hypothetical protein DFH29DRAFT_238760 [Suillus ampliporus]